MFDHGTLLCELFCNASHCIQVWQFVHAPCLFWEIVPAVHPRVPLSFFEKSAYAPPRVHRRTSST
ncbi:hypothetical protein ARMA_2041 [Ardenticatena maritima]|uniref:Uncharacterized protein n=1 Tax=Ardenticatena maritima TaxID=872965 RepID=A0A0M8KA77_9CHLR|nr:hypothetical protein ARMA_2041 [Ardenticatena maritima]